ncbi:hypothetical protein CF326_g8915 [Tilletia indica]|nr:hypothetical protein CF326_g8915 [Tilletia indica]
MLLPPPDDEAFDTKQEGLAYLQTWAQMEGYAVTTYASSKDVYLYIGCHKQGTYKNSHQLTDQIRKRKTSSAKSGCPFRVRLKVNHEGKWVTAVTNPSHNHPASTSPLAHAVQRRIDVATKYQIIELARQGTRPSRIVSMLVQRPIPLLVTSKDVSNLLQRHRREVLHGRAPAEALLEWLREQEWPHITKIAAVDTGVERLEGLFFAHPRGLELLRRFGTVILIDATYNTNQHRLPLLHMVGITSSNRSFTVALAFLPDETTMTYSWALSALQQLAPDWNPDVVVTDDDAALGAALLNTLTSPYAHIHCQWHVRQNVEKQARPRLLDQELFHQFMSDFDELRDSTTPERLTEARDQLEARWGDIRQDLVDYVDGKLSSEHLWVSFYVNRHPHMNSRTTSRAEGCHATLKQYLHSRHGNLFSVTQALKNHFVVQHTQIESDIANDNNKVPINILGDRFYVQVANTVSRYALRLIQAQDEMGRQAVESAQRSNETGVMRCTCIITVTMGLPCSHTLSQLRANSQPIPLSSIHPQWRTDEGLQNVRFPRLLDPLNPEQRKVAAATKATGRLLTAAELAKAKARKQTRHCSNCMQAGHNCSRCPLPCGRCQSADHKVNSCLL